MMYLGAENALFLSEHVTKNRESTSSRMRVCESPCSSRLQPIVGWIHLQNTPIALAFARWDFFYCFKAKKLKKKKKTLTDKKCDSYTRVSRKLYGNP